MKKEAYYQSLPKKRMGAGCLFVNDDEHILLVKPTYKQGWEIPGGIVEQNESPKACCAREIVEELGLELEIGRLLVVDYNSPSDPKTESLMFIFDGGKLTKAQIHAIRLPEDELSEYAFFAPNNLPTTMTETLRKRVLATWQRRTVSHDLYLENQKTTS